ncbi:phosphate transporter [Boothiomyces sp. JEL0838]|nr:phosphate transporter [Boothiomyces sp. JEL0838]
MHMNLCTTRFLLPAFILTIVDWLVRIFRLSTSTVVLQNEKIGSITKIVLKTDKKVYKPGQWFLLYVPPFDLHPFSVTTTSFNGQPALGFAVSSCGKFTRTISSIHTFRIDGPYGNSFDDILKHKKIILIAGGIGITPLLNIVDFAKKMNLEDKSIGIEFIFVANSINTLDAFEQELVEVKGVSSLTCFLTKSTLVSTDAGYDRPFPIETGRPDFVQLLSKQKNEHLSSIGVAVCGPKDMIISVREAALEEKDTVELDAREQALKELNEANWGMAHWRAILVAGSGFLTDSYDNFVIGIMTTIIGYVYFGWNKNKIPDFDNGWLKAASSWGNLTGQFFFGILGDILGRKKMYGIELIILIIGSVGCALAAPPARGFGFAGVLGFWRFILGVGVGGDYPVSGVITSEFASTKNRGTMIALVFAMQGVGILLGSAVSVLALLAYQNMIRADPTNLDYVWRVMAGFGCIPALCAVYFRLTIPETPRYALDVEKDIAKGAAATKQFMTNKMTIVHEEEHIAPAKEKKPFHTSFIEYFGKWGNLKVLIGTAFTWFFLDIGFYGTNLNTSTIISAIGWGAPPSPAAPYDVIWNLAAGSAIVNLCGNFPGYFFTVFFVDRIGRKPIQFLGFAMLTLAFLFMAIFFDTLTKNYIAAFVFLYCFAQFFFNFGPNSTTFIIPAEAFPTKVRSSAHGISAAAGKAGAIIAAQGFDPLKSQNGGMSMLLWIFAGCCFLGLLFTFLVPETKGKSLEELGDYE